MSKAVLISIQPKWCEKIARGEKTIEVRKSSPKLEPPFKCYIYCTLPPRSELFSHGCIREYANELIRLQSGEIIYGYGMQLCCDPEHRPYSKDNFLCKKVIGEFTCDGVYAVLAHPSVFAGHPVFYKKAIEDACLTDKEIEEYSGGKDLCGWHISDLVIYDRPKELSEFFTYDRAYENSMAWAFTEEEKRKPVTRPPQSWCYVEEVQGDAKED